MIPQMDGRLPQRFWDKVVVSRRTGCWLWTGTRDPLGYGRYSIGRKMPMAHRAAYEALVGPIPEGFDIDHVRARGCASRGCVNPAHLEAVTHHENVLRGDVGQHNKRKTHCPQGHAYEGSNLYLDKNGGRGCIACRKAHAAAHNKRKRAAAKCST